MMKKNRHLFCFMLSILACILLAGIGCSALPPKGAVVVEREDIPLPLYLVSFESYKSSRGGIHTRKIILSGEDFKIEDNALIADRYYTEWGLDTDLMWDRPLNIYGSFSVEKLRESPQR